MAELEETPEPSVEKTRIEKIAGPAIWVGCFIIWPATSIATAVIGYKSLDKQLAIETLRAAAREQ